MNPETLVVVANIAVGIVTMLPVIVCLELCKRSNFSEKKYLISGMVLIVWAVIIFSILSESLVNIKIAAEGNIISDGLKDGFQKVANIWMYALPAISLAIGSNLITAYYTKSYSSDT